jgi:hypothetical protein
VSFLRGGPADGCEVPRTLRVITVRVEDGKPILRDGEVLTASVQPRSAQSQWVPYVWNESAGEYRAVRGGHEPPWYDRLPRSLALSRATT